MILVIFGATLELLQYYVPNRSFDLIDIAANTLGVLLGMILANYFSKYRISSS
jgi:VanZ family protein